MTDPRGSWKGPTVALFAILVPMFLSAPVSSSVSPKAGYVGSERCGSCHQIQFKGWRNTFHSTVIQDARRNPSAILGDMSVAELPFKKGDIDFTVGGHWDQRYLTRIEDDYYVLPRLWSVQSRKWRPYSTYGWQKRPYSKYCIGCHSIGFDPKTREVAEHTIGCESCHGPGAQHAAKPVGAGIVNPKRLPEDRREEICASCHVRGKDLSGEYYFPIGWVPGEDLANYLVPLEKNEGEGNGEAIHRLWDKWRTDRETRARSRCDVCGIPSDGKPKKPPAGSDGVCKGCHAFEENLASHTRHKPDTNIGCLDCHFMKSPDLKENKEKNIHSYGFFLVHSQGCWDKDVYKRCGSCHTGKTERWAYEIYQGWIKSMFMDH